jgi:hypothetical protein
VGGERGGEEDADPGERSNRSPGKGGVRSKG